MSKIDIIHFPDVSSDDISQLKDALRTISDEVSSLSKPPGAYNALEYLLPAAIVVMVGQPIFEGFLKKIGEGAANRLGNGLVAAFEALKRVGARWHKSGAKEPGPLVAPLSLNVPISPGGVRFVFPADLDAQQMRNALAQIEAMMHEGQAAIKRAEKLRKRDQVQVSRGQYPTEGPIGEKYYQRVYVYRPERGRWVDVYKLVEETIHPPDSEDLAKH